MRSSTRLSAMSLLLAVLTLACAPAPIQNEINPQHFRPDAVTIIVKNDAPIAATVYIFNGVSRIRLGEVPAGSSGRFSVRAFGESASFYITTPWDNRASTNTLDHIRAGDRLLVSIDPTVTSPFLSR